MKKYDMYDEYTRQSKTNDKKSQKKSKYNDDFLERDLPKPKPKKQKYLLDEDEYDYFG